MYRLCSLVPLCNLLPRSPREVWEWRAKLGLGVAYATLSVSADERKNQASEKLNVSLYLTSGFRVTFLD